MPSGELVILMGDSIGRQQLVSMLCLAWASEGFEYAVHKCHGEGASNTSTSGAGDTQSDDVREECAALARKGHDRELIGG